MRRKYGRLRKKENIVVFPGTFEKLVEQGTTYVETGDYEKAVEEFDQAILYEPDYPEFLVPYAIALYEIKEFERAKEIASQLLHSGTANYIEAMELYITISIQLQEYEEVELTIEALMDEKIVPEELVNKFTYLRDLNNRMWGRYGKDMSTGAEVELTIEEFDEMDVMTQQHTLASLEDANLIPLIPLLKEVSERREGSPLVKTFALTLLGQASYTDEIVVRKFDFETTVVPAEMTLPGADEKTQAVLFAMEQLLEKDPSRLSLATGLIEKFAITAFPFSWGNWSPEEIASAYDEYIESLFANNILANNQLNILIKRVDLVSELEKG
ncbi:tetratricopeptide repeat protein [Sporosarcina sp. G11-34]|uniref:tetratricopeptide repeat protein n=1 Tax=Sporosarcina sp. G11-34 TaxID=2849605 RepID=UPI0022A8EAC5|nr:tetratricopeptide repeat protein [Sporosarcina sp. G11-34]MCZ2258432.1 tetratricopeptide repeat protein [Sporosarcina sp. G11-34]